MSRAGNVAGRFEIHAVLAESRRLFIAVGLFSAFVNLLMLTGPVFMLQIYDRVLPSRSEATLVALAGITAFLFLMMGLLDYARTRVLARAGARFQARLDGRVLSAILHAGRQLARFPLYACHGPAGPGSHAALRLRPRAVRLLRCPLDAHLRVRVVHFSLASGRAGGDLRHSVGGPGTAEPGLHRAAAPHGAGQDPGGLRYYSRALAAEAFTKEMRS